MRDLKKFTVYKQCRWRSVLSQVWLGTEGSVWCQHLAPKDAASVLVPSPIPLLFHIPHNHLIKN